MKADISQKNKALHLITEHVKTNKMVGCVSIANLHNKNAMDTGYSVSSPTSKMEV